MSKKLAVLACSVVLLAAGGFGWLGGYRADGSGLSTSAGNGSLMLNVRSDQAEAEVMKENAFLLTLEDSDGKPVERASIQAYLVMPDMFCGRIPAEALEVAPGQYKLLAIPVMPGKWQAEISVASGYETLQATHPFNAYN